MLKKATYCLNSVNVGKTQRHIADVAMTIQPKLCEASFVDGAPSIVVDHDGIVTYDRYFLDPLYAQGLFNRLISDVDWKQDFIMLYGRRIAIPRRTAWYGDREAVYTYSKIENVPAGWSSELRELRDKVQLATGVAFNSVLLNRYRSGEDSVSWHADDEPELGLNPIIASVSLGATRTFQLQHKVLKEKRCSVPLENGSLLLMTAGTQASWKHHVPKERAVRGERINLTFRTVHATAEASRTLSPGRTSQPEKSSTG